MDVQTSFKKPGENVRSPRHSSGENPILVSFGKRVRAYRRERGLSQEKLAELANYTPWQVQKVEYGEISVSLVCALRIAAALGVAPGDLFGDLSD